MGDSARTMFVGAAIFLCACVAVAGILAVQLAPGLVPIVSRQPSASGDWFAVHMTTPRYPDRESDHRGGIDGRLSSAIDGARSTVDVAIYQLDLTSITQALINAKKRGATVRVVTDRDTLADSQENRSYKQLQTAGIPVVGGNASGIMHNKFVILDRAAVWTGSLNLTESDIYRNNNNAIFIQSAELAENYTATFEKMFTKRQFGSARKAGETTPRVTIGAATVESYFSPEDGVSAKIRSRLKQAKGSIDFMAYAFTSDEIGKVLQEAAKAGIKVRGVIERVGSETEFSEYGRLRKAGLDVWQDGNPYSMHHKVFIVDGQTVILGSANFTKSAADDNDENLLVVVDAAVALVYQSEFNRVYEQAKAPPRK